MDHESKDFYSSAIRIFSEYTKNKSAHQQYIEQLNQLTIKNQSDHFYQLFILNFIYLDLEEYQMVLDNANQSITIYQKLNLNRQEQFHVEYLLSCYHALLLKHYFDSNIDLDHEFKTLQKELNKEKNNSLIKELINKINIYFNIVSQCSKEDLFIENIKHIDFNVFKFIYENVASSVFSRDDKIKFISHYTSIGNSFNILNHKQLWVSRFDFLNDKSELTYFIENYPQLMKQLKKDIEHHSNDFSEEEKHFLLTQLVIVEKIVSVLFGILPNSELNEEEKRLVKDMDKEYFVLSFSKNQDSLSLWGNYTEFNGVNLQFNKERFIQSLNNKKINPLYFIDPKKDIYQNKDFTTFFFGEVLYDLKKVRKHILKDFKQTLELHKKSPKGIKEFVVTRILIHLLLIRRFFTKVDYFKFEEEYRFIFTIDKAIYNKMINFRTTKEYYVPYIKIPIQLETLKEIMVGPKNNSDLVSKGFKEYINYKNLDITVNKSNIPFR